jgi:hypothetical protein
MVGAVVPEFEFEGFAAEREAAELVTEANAKDRHASSKLTNIFLRVHNGLRITGAIR